jgi:glycosyltransferase involved in cell wall biosynthesis
LGGTIDSGGDGRAREAPAAIVVAARDEAQRIGDTLRALAGAFPGAAVWVDDDCSRDGTGAIAQAAGARVVRGERPRGKGAAVTETARAALASLPERSEAVVLLCDGDLGACAARLGPLVDVVVEGGADLAVARFARPAGGGFGAARGFSAWAIRRRCAVRTLAPMSGQRALTAGTLAGLLPLAGGYGMEVGMTIDALRAGRRLVEIELDLTHRVTGRTPAGFLHRARQLLDVARAYAVRGRIGWHR